jgi:hypothetical protein
MSRTRCSAKLIRAFTPVFAGCAERCSADPGQASVRITTLSQPLLDRAGLSGKARADRLVAAAKIEFLGAQGHLEKYRWSDPCKSDSVL